MGSIGGLKTCKANQHAPQVSSWKLEDVRQSGA